MSKVEPTARTDAAELERLDDQALARLVKERANQPTIPVSGDDLSEADEARERGGRKSQEMRGEYRVGTGPAGRDMPEAVTRQSETGLADPMSRTVLPRV